MSEITDTDRLTWLLSTGNYGYIDRSEYPAHVDIQAWARQRIDRAMRKEKEQAEAEARGEWLSLEDTSPPYELLVETKGGYSDDRIVRDYFSRSIGDWMRQPGDPTHWRHIPKSEPKQETSSE